MFERRIRFQRPLLGVRCGDPSVTVRLGRDCAPGPSASRTAAQLALDAARLVELLSEINDSVSELKQWHRHSLNELQQVAVDLAVSIASHVVHRKIEQGDVDIMPLVEQLASAVDPDLPLTVRLSPADYENLDQLLEGRAPPWAEQRKIRLVADPAVTPGDCRVCGDDFDLVSKVATRLEQIKQQLLNNLPHAQLERRNTAIGGQQLGRFPNRRETA